MNKEKIKKLISIITLIFSDMLVVYISIFLAFITRKILSGILDIPELEFVFKHSSYYILISLIFVTIFIYEKLYTLHLTFWDEAKLILKSVTLGIIFTLAMITLNKSDSEVSRLSILITWFYLIILLPFIRCKIKLFLFDINIYSLELVIVSDSISEANRIKKAIEQERNLCYNIKNILIFTKDISKDSVNQIIIEKPEAIMVVIEDSNIRESIVNRLQHLVKKIFFLPSLKKPLFLNSKIEYLFDSQISIINFDNNLNRVTNRFIKKISDILIALILIPITFPVLLTIALAIRVSTNEKSLFFQERLGRGDKKFKCIKFQTMHPNADKLLDEFLSANPKEHRHWREYKKIKGVDPRVTKIGRFLRETSLDELPQIFNVLRGDMSFIGPRPYLERELKDMLGSDETIRIAKPGITGLWQVLGRSRLSFEKRVELDEWYVQNWSLWLDFIILVKTIKVVFKKVGAY